MKTIMKFGIGGLIAVFFPVQLALAQDSEERMQRDIKVAESVLSTLIKQALGEQGRMLGYHVQGSYQPGFGATFRLPDFPFGFIYVDRDFNAITITGQGQHTYVVPSAQKSEPNSTSLEERTREVRRIKADSTVNEYYQRLVAAAKDFIIDYGDLITQLGEKEKIMITNRRDHDHYIGSYFYNVKRNHLVIEGTKADVTAFRKGTLTREQALNKITVVNTEPVATKETDLELLSSVMSRLYNLDLSTTYFIEGNIYYERLKDYGVVYYMKVYSSHERGSKRYDMPTLRVEDASQETRDKKVKEVYPRFEAELKDNILEYAKMLKSLKDDELLVFNVKLTQCKGCGIPSTLELSLKFDVARAFAAGKITKEAALEKMVVKKGPMQ